MKDYEHVKYTSFQLMMHGQIRYCPHRVRIGVALDKKMIEVAKPIDVIAFLHKIKFFTKDQVRSPIGDLYMT